MKVYGIEIEYQAKHTPPSLQIAWLDRASKDNWIMIRFLRKNRPYPSNYFYDIFKKSTKAA